MNLQDYLVNEDKVYVDVNVNHHSDGRILPQSFVWENGQRYEITSVIDIRNAASLRAGGAGIRFIVRVGMKEATMYLEEDHGKPRWFMERKES